VLLALSVISQQGANLGATAYKIFDERGGSIGRLDSNDWSLPDPERFVSSRHAVVRFEGGVFCLEDVSTNGTFINAPEQAVSRAAPVKLKDGDRLYIGDYEILVQLIEEAAPSEPSSIAVPALLPDAGAIAGTISSLGTDDPLAVIGVGSAIAPSPPEPLPPPAPRGRALQSPAPAAEPQSMPQSVPQPVSDVPAPPPLPPAIPRVLAPSAAPAHASAGARDLFAALGLDSRDVDPEVAGHIGAIVRIVVQGVIEVLRARAEVKNNFRMPMTSIRARENNPLKFSLNAEDALYNLFVKRNPGFLGPVEAFQEGFQDIASHELAMVAAIRAAYQSMLAKFNPTHLEEAYTRKLRRTSVIPIGGRLKFWDMYCTQFEDIEKDAEASFQLLFGEEFAKAYHEQLDRLTRSAKSQKK